MNLCKLNTIATIYNGNSINKTEKEQKYMNDVPGWNYIGTKDIDFNGKVTYKNGVIIPYTETKFRVAPAGTIFVCSEGGSAGKKSAIISEDVCFGNKLFAIVNDKGKFSSKYIYYYTRYSGFTKQFKLLATSLMGGISGKNFGTIEVPLPSIEEQQKIVTRIEELFSELDKGVETLQTIKQQLAVYRQAVLKEAFATVKQYVPFGSFIDSRLGKMLDKEKNTGSFHKYLRNINVRWFSFDTSDLLEMKIENSEMDKYTIHNGDLVICEGGEPGRCAVWSKDEPICYQKALHRVRFTNGSNPYFYMYYLWFAAQTGKLNSYYTGTGIKHLTGQSLVKLPVPITYRIQQDEIVEMIESRLSVCDSIEQTVDTALAQAEATRQSILKKAFEGGFSE